MQSMEYSMNFHQNLTYFNHLFAFCLDDKEYYWDQQKLISAVYSYTKARDLHI